MGGILSGIRVESGVVYSDYYKRLMLFKEGNPKASMQIDISGFICGSNDRFIYLQDDKTMKIVDANEMTPLVQT